MKRTLIIVALVLVISTSIIAGTLAMYTITIDDLAEGSVVAKEFVLEAGETVGFSDNVKIAPGETEEWQFSVKNYKGEGEDAVVSETAMDLEFEITLTNAEGKTAIAPLEVTVKDEEDDELILNNNKFTDEFPLDNEGQEKTYTVSVEWPWETNGVDDIDYAGAEHGTAIKVSVTGVQK